MLPASTSAKPITPELRRQAVFLKVQGLSWESIAQRLDRPVAELEQLPWHDRAQWDHDYALATTALRQEIIAQSIAKLCQSLAETTEPKLLATLTNALARLLKLQEGNARSEPPTTRQQAPDVPPMIAEPIIEPIVVPDPVPAIKEGPSEVVRPSSAPWVGQRLGMLALLLCVCGGVFFAGSNQNEKRNSNSSKQIYPPADVHPTRLPLSPDDRAQKQAPTGLKGERAPPRWGHG